MQWILVCYFLLFSLSQTGCASFNRKLKNFLGGGSPSPSTQAAKPANTMTRFSDSADIGPRVKRQYKRTTKESLSEESALDSKAGSLWVMEGQGAYLFSQNIVRLVGDPLAINLDGDPKDQLQSKANVIKKLIAKIEEKQRLRLRGPASDGGADDEGKDGKEGKEGKGEKEKKEKSQAAQQPKAEEPPMELAVKNIPTRVIERTLEGNYRVKGSQPFMIGSREYKIIVTGVVKAEDFNDDGISATKLLESKFDIVSARHKETEL